MKVKTPPMFIADCHLGKLAKYLRVMGFDTLYFNTIDDNDLIELANSQQRIILTRDKALDERENAPSFYLDSINNLEQLQALQEHFCIKSYNLTSRCTVCNTKLEAIAKNKIEERIPPKVKKYFSKFEICNRCDHYKRMLSTIDAI